MDHRTGLGACGVNYLVPYGPDPDAVQEAAKSVRVVDFFYGEPTQVVDAVRIPVLAAGGVATAERVLERLRSGADGVRVGTRFLASPESGAHQEYIDCLLAATAEDTVLSEWFNEGWENAPHRVLRACEAAARRSGWRSTAPPRRGMGREEASDMAMYAGTGVGEVRAVQPAAEIVADLVSLLA